MLKTKKSCPYTPHHEEVLVSGGEVPCILNLSTRWRWVISFTL